MNQKIITKKELQDVSLLLDIVWPDLIDKWMKQLPTHIQICRLSDSEIRRRVIYELNLCKELESYGFIYPIYIIKAALLTRKKYKYGNHFPNKQTLKKWFNSR